MITRLKTLLAKLEVCVKTNKKDLSIYDDYESLLSALCKFWNDDTAVILKAFVPNGNVGKNDVVKAFNSKSKSYLTRPSKMLNKLKHNQRKIVCFNAYINEQIIPGFFIGINKAGKWYPLKCITILEIMN